MTSPISSLVVRRSDMRSLRPAPRGGALQGWVRKPLAPYRELCARSVPASQPAVPPPAVPADLLDANSAGAALGYPAAIVRHWATQAPARLPAFVLIDGAPYFTRAALGEVVR
ncbi:hypothetical protein GCM10010488_21980 [Oerskovia jenensis]|uniref:Uncharacterized protein n=1 Tax=Oerskovia jenensis TaxID=162169 RepID=A0ABS2LEW7_9CELL|nr:hypothetical protein [Oerskovia jenensis]